MPSKTFVVPFLVAILGLLAPSPAHAGLKDRSKSAQQARDTAKDAREKAKKETEKQKGQLRSNLKKAIDATDKQVSALKAKAAKLPEDQRAKAEAAFAAYDQAKGIAQALVATLDAADNVQEAASVGSKIKEALEGAQRAAKAYKSAVEA